MKEQTTRNNQAQDKTRKLTANGEPIRRKPKQKMPPKCGHSDRPMYAKDMCRLCYLAQWRKDYIAAHPDWKPPVSPNRAKAVEKYNNSVKGKMAHVRHQIKKQKESLDGKPSLKEKKAMIAKLLKGLDPTKFNSLSTAALRLLESKYGLNNKPLLLLKQLIAELGITRQRIHQIEQDTLQSLLGKM
jgi:DNA-directed RNA polymerase sigma subunit (sigma70/sigma32)